MPSISGPFVSFESLPDGTPFLYKDSDGVNRLYVKGWCPNDAFNATEINSGFIGGMNDDTQVINALGKVEWIVNGVKQN